ncbi:ABC transporter ATP-binding protein [Catenovulum adriaticum]|uniref:ABC transporter ATP-binding protein n=1 Tax=Catenovulum adriaticum TaxID=2984846 RepID=A0ABY7AHZ7_9ALTE|nr:ABC transporter ATP-binding protein [Catenovulum sp. TS8]WAJ69230.1 ABC transporter ATP-binding protein [Catenovulum sp. TS8]
MSSILSVKKLSKTVISNGEELKILSDCQFEINAGESVAIVGRSGSGKSTLLSLLAGLDVCEQGEIELAGQSLNRLDEEQRALLRGQHVGFVFQSFMLVQSLTALENVMLPLELNHQAKAKEQASELLSAVGLADRGHHYPNQLSGGEQQRVAVARAFASKPDILFADEPTGNLDAENGHKVENLLFELNKAQGTTLVLVTHDLNLAKRCQRQLQMQAGQLTEITQNITNQPKINDEAGSYAG